MQITLTDAQQLAVNLARERVKDYLLKTVLISPTIYGYVSNRAFIHGVRMSIPMQCKENDELAEYYDYFRELEYRYFEKKGRIVK